VGDLMVGAVAHEDGLAKEHDEGAGFVGEPAAVGLVEVDDEVVGDVALGAEDGGFEGAVEGGRGELADGVGAGADGCDGQIHLCFVGYHCGDGLFDRGSSRRYAEWRCNGGWGGWTRIWVWVTVPAR
jgi:hypothetical protein